MHIVPDQLRGPERVFFPSAQALLCWAALCVAYTAAQVLLPDATTPAELNGPVLNAAYSLLLATKLSYSG